jgi:hypothetical protein
VQHDLGAAQTIYSKTRKFGALLYLAALAQRTLCAKISCALKVFSFRFEDMLLLKCAKINLHQCLHSGVCANICMRQIFLFYSTSQTISIFLMLLMNITESVVNHEILLFFITQIV